MIHVFTVSRRLAVSQRAIYFFARLFIEDIVKLTKDSMTIQ